jgi:NTE family protein
MHQLTVTKFPFARSNNLRTIANPIIYCFLAVFLSSCALTIQNQPVNVPQQSKNESGSSSRISTARNIVGENLIGFSFSGGGMRAAAFSFGAIKALESLESQLPGIVEDITFITSVSGGSLTAAYYGLNGRQSLSQFRENVLLKDAEVDI